MIERVALTVSLISFFAACVGIVLRWDRSLFVFQVRFSLSTLLIFLAIMPPVLAWAIPAMKLWLNSPRTEPWFVRGKP